MSDSGREWPSERGGPPMRHPIPEDLKERHALIAQRRANWLPGIDSLRRISLDKKMSMIERIARLDAELREAKKECDEYRLDDSILRKAYEESGMGQRFTWHGWLLQLVRENATLRATVARLSAPVSDEEWLNGWRVQARAPQLQGMRRATLDALIAARAKEPQHGE